MFSILFNYRGEDLLFTIIRCLTILSYCAWPMVAFLAIMAFSNSANSERPMVSYGITALYFLVLSYPLIFMSIVNYAEKQLAGTSYPLAVMVSVIPVILVTAVIWKFASAPGYVHEHQEVPRPFEIGKLLEFGGFTIEYLGQDSEKPDPRLSVTLFTDSFRIIGKKDGVEQIVNVTSGQLPPEPTDFEVDGNKFALTIYKLSDGTVLEKRHLAIIKR